MNEELSRAVARLAALPRAFQDDRRANILRVEGGIIELANGFKRGDSYNSAKLDEMLRQWAKILADNV